MFFELILSSTLILVYFPSNAFDDCDFDKGKRGFFTTMKSDYVSIEILGLYWHFVDLVWVFIFAFFYLW